MKVPTRTLNLLYSYYFVSPFVVNEVVTVKGQVTQLDAEPRLSLFSLLYARKNKEGFHVLSKTEGVLTTKK